MKRNDRSTRVGLVIDGTDHFIRPIEAQLHHRHHVDRFAPRFVRLPLIGRRVNEKLLDWQLQRFIRNHDITFFEWAASLLIRATHLPKQGRIVTRLHSVELATAVEQVDWSQVDHLIVLNEATLARLRDIVKQPLPVVSIVANGVDLERFQIRLQPFRHRLGMVCKVLPIKRIYEIVLCVYQLRQDGYPFTLHVAGANGEGDARRYSWALQGLIDKLGMHEVVTFYGYVADVPAWLQNIDVFISNSYWEGQQVALLEAMASGCYCLSHCWGGAEEILPQQNIFITDTELREKLISYVRWSETERIQAQNLLRSIVEEKFDERRMVEEIIEIIEAEMKG